MYVRVPLRPFSVGTLPAADLRSLPSQIWASARENRISHFVLTDTREFVFGEVGLAPALHRDVEDPLAISTIGRGRVFGVEVGLQGTGDFEAVPQGTEGVMSVK